MNTIPQNMIACSVEHKYAGNLWAVVATYDDDWTHITSATKHVGSQFFLVWSKLLKPENSPLKQEAMERINQIRDDLASGRKIIKDTRLVNS